MCLILVFNTNTPGNVFTRVIVNGLPITRSCTNAGTLRSVGAIKLWVS